MIENMYVEEVVDPTVKTPHYESLVQFGLALGLTRKDFADYEPLPATIMAINYWDNVGKTKPWLEAFAAPRALTRDYRDRVRTKSMNLLTFVASLSIIRPQCSCGPRSWSSYAWLSSRSP